MHDYAVFVLNFSMFIDVINYVQNYLVNGLLGVARIWRSSTVAGRCPAPSQATGLVEGGATRFDRSVERLFASCSQLWPRLGRADRGGGVAGVPVRGGSEKGAGRGGAARGSDR